MQKKMSTNKTCSLKEPNLKISKRIKTKKTGIFLCKMHRQFFLKTFFWEYLQLML